ncbi:unnamed protein product [Urochloa humidicola]
MLHGSCLSGEKGGDAVRWRGAAALQRRSAVVEEKEAAAAAVRQQEKALLKAQANRVASLVGAASSTTGVPCLNHGCYLVFRSYYMVHSQFWFNIARSSILPNIALRNHCRTVSKIYQCSEVGTTLNFSDTVLIATYSGIRDLHFCTVHC